MKQYYYSYKRYEYTITQLHRLLTLLQKISKLQSRKILSLKEENSRLRDRLSLYEPKSVTRKYTEIS